MGDEMTCLDLRALEGCDISILVSQSLIHAIETLLRARQDTRICAAGNCLPLFTPDKCYLLYLGRSLVRVGEAETSMVTFVIGG
jgi:hypothetical protein